MKWSTIPPASFSVVLVSNWTLALILSVWLFDLPGGRGPIQYAAGHRQAMFIFNLRVITILAMIAVPILAGALVGVCSEANDNLRRQVWRIMALVSYVIAWIAIFRVNFFPVV